MKQTLPLTAAESACLWARHRQGDSRARAELIDRHRYLVRITVARLVPVCPDRVDREDLEAEGSLALVRAVDQYEPERGVKFTTFAVSVIRWAVRDYLRRDDWLSRCTRKCLAAEGSVPTLESLDAFLAEQEEEPSFAARRILPLIADRQPLPAEVVETREMARLIRGLVQALPARQRGVIVGSYWCEQTLKQMAARCNRSEARVQQYRQMALAELRQAAEAAGIGGEE